MDDNAQEAPIAVPHVELTLPGAPGRQRLHDRGGLLLGANRHHDANDRPTENLLRGYPYSASAAGFQATITQPDPSRSAPRPPPNSGVRDQSR